MFYIYEDPNNSNVVIAMCVFDKVSFEQFGKLLRERGVDRFVRLRQRLHEYFNYQYWEKVTVDDAMGNYLDKTGAGVHNEQDAQKFAEKLINENDVKKQWSYRPPWRMHYVGDYSETEALFAF